MDAPQNQVTLGELYRVVMRIDKRTERLEDVVFVGHENQPALLSQIAAVKAGDASRDRRSAGIAAGVSGLITVLMAIAQFLGIELPPTSAR